MANTKNFGLAGIGADVQFGKKGGSLRYVVDAPNGATGSPAFQVRNSTNDNLLRLQAAAPVYSDDLATKLYVDNAVQGLDLKSSVRLASAKEENVALTGATPLSIDSVTVNVGDRVLLKSQTNATQNGIYEYRVTGGNYTLVRSADANNSDNPNSEVSGGMFAFVELGAENTATGWVLSSPSGDIVLGTDELTFTQFSSAGVTSPGAGMSKDGVVFNVNVDGITVQIDGNNQLAIKSSATAGQSLISAGSGSATWGALDLSNTSATQGALPASRGGTGNTAYSIGDVLVGNGANGLTRLAVGANNTVLGVSESGSLLYKQVTNLRDAAGKLLVEGAGVTDAVNFLTVKNSAGTDAVELGSDGNADDVSILLNAKGAGLVVAPTGYSDAFYANRATISEDAFAPKGFVEERVNSIDTTRIQNAETTTFFATDLSGFADRATIGSNGKVVGEFVGVTDEGVATNGERLQITHVTDEIHLKAVNSSGVGDVSLRLVPQAQGQVFIGTTGSGLIQAEPGYQLTLKGGDSTPAFDASDVIVRGGDALTGDFNGGNVIIRAGVNSGVGERGKTTIQDDRQVSIVDFVSPSAPASNWMEIENSIADVDPIVSAVKLRVAAASSSGDVSMLLDPKGNGLVRVADASTYLASLKTNGQLDALVTKGYVAEQLTSSNKEAGMGLTDTGGIFDVNVGASTIKVDSSDNLIVNSSATQNQVLLSSGVNGGEATWGALPLANANAVSGILGISNGGTGLNSFVAGDIMVGTAGGALTKLTKGPNNSILQVSNTGTLTWGYSSQLRDGDGLLVANAQGVASAVNNLTFKNAALTGAVEIGSEGTDGNISIVLNPKGTGLVIGKAGYTANIGPNRETFITKGYVDDALQFNTDPLMRRVAITSGFSAVMDVGNVTPSVAGRTVYIHRVTMNIIAPLTGGNVALARVTAGPNEIMNFDENDVAQTGVYVADIPFSFASSNTQVKVEFYEADGATASTPTAGNVVIIAEYKIM